MGTVVELHPHHDQRSGEHGSMVGWLRDGAHRGAELLRLWWSNHQTLAELERLDERMLRDIGIDDADLDNLRRHPFEDHLDLDWRKRRH